MSPVGGAAIRRRRGSEPPPRLVVLNDWPTPYRLPLFRRLAEAFPGLTVLFSTGRVREYAWELAEDLPFQFEVLPRLELRLRRPPYGEPRIVHLNPTLLARLVRLRPDAVVSYAFSLPTWTAMVYARVSRTPLLSWSNDTPHTERHLGRLQRLSRRLVIPRAAACITASRQGRDKFLAYGAAEERVFRVHQAPEVGLYAAAADEARRAGAAPAALAGLEGPVVLCVGRLTELKGVLRLLDVFGRVRKRVTAARLLFVGDGPLRARLEERAEASGLAEAVRFAGFVQPHEMPALYAGADLFVFPTLGDTFGAVLGEAAACGLPIVASPFAGGAAEYVREGANGWIVDPREPRALAERIVELLADPVRREAMGRASRRLALEHGPDRAAAIFRRAVYAACGRELGSGDDG